MNWQRGTEKEPDVVTAANTADVAALLLFTCDGEEQGTGIRK